MLDRALASTAVFACGVTDASSPGRARLDDVIDDVAGERDEPSARAGDFAAERRDRLRLTHSLAERPAVGRATRTAGVL